MNFKNKKMIIIVFAISVLCIMFVPMLYSFIYLKSIWDAYGNIDKVPVAFVNSDKAYVEAGKKYDIGNELENKLKDNAKVAWKFVNHEKAIKGVEGTDYYAVVEIPQDFSKKIANSQDGKFSSPQIIYIANKGKNFVFSQISEKVAQSVKTEINSSIQKEISKALVDSLYDVKISIKAADDGANQLQEAQQKLLDASVELKDGTGKAADGSVQLENGLGDAVDVSGRLHDGTEQLLSGSVQLSDGINKAKGGSVKLLNGLRNADAASEKLQEGTQQLLDGSIDLSNGLYTASDGSKKLQDGMSSLMKGEVQVSNGLDTLIAGLNTFKSSLNNSDEKNTQIGQLVEGASQLNKNTAAIEQGAEKLNTSLNTGLTSAADGVKQASSGISNVAALLSTIDSSGLNDVDKAKLATAISGMNSISTNMNTRIEQPLRGASSSAQPLVDNLKLLNAGTEKIAAGISQMVCSLADTQTKAVDALGKLIGGASSIKDGNSEIICGSATIYQKSGELSDGLEKLRSGAVSLKDGLKNVNNGNTALKNGLDTATAKTGELSNGLSKLRYGAITLKNGIKEVNSGNITLKEGLNTAYLKIGELSKGLGQLCNGLTIFSNGLSESNDGAIKLSDGLKSGYSKISEKLTFSSEGMSEFLKEPVTVKNSSINETKYYGEGLAPYFISLSLWIGALFISIILTITKKIKPFKTKFSNSFSMRFIIGSIFVTIQALILSSSLLKGVGIKPVNITDFYFSNIFISIVFFSIMYGVSNALGFIGAPIMFVVLILQLASSAGTFPIETAPVFYRTIGNFIPMTYSVNMLRMIISGINSSLFSQDIMKLLIFMLVFLLGGAAIRLKINFIKRKIAAVKLAEAA